MHYEIRDPRLGFDTPHARSRIRELDEAASTANTLSLRLVGKLREMTIRRSSTLQPIWQLEEVSAFRPFLPRSNSIMASYPYIYDRFEDSHYYNVNEVVNATLQNMRDEKEWCNTQPASYLEENVDVDTLSNVEENADTPVENYCRETTQGLEVLPIEPNMFIAPNDNDDDVVLEIGVISKRSEEPQIESKEDQPLVLVKPPTLPCIFDKPYTGVEVKERCRFSTLLTPLCWRTMM
ncbi:hypothetical protein Syun_013785 [Stephania yunnanensis]|uniref:Uncharacterized protein n=1 Tax=Stephania yunnanensis TaxID=152371 RepID=A0AAP0PB63_9MAGN